VFRRSAALLTTIALAACGGSGPEPSQSDDSSIASNGDASDAASSTHDAIDAEAGGDATEGQGDPPIDAGPIDATPHDAGADAPTTSGAALLAEEAHRELTAMISSTYQHTTFVDESKGIFDYDCSGFVDYALARVLPDALTTLQTATEPRPLAKDFETFFAGVTTSSGRWTSVARAIDLVPGDIVAWLKPLDVTSSNTGHVMIVRELPTKNPKDASEILVPITDSTETPHGPTDSRTATGATGLGTGTIGLLVDATGAPQQYHWTGAYSTKAETTSIALGHIE
jgi:hypothetical protein